MNHALKLESFLLNHPRSNFVILLLGYPHFLESVQGSQYWTTDNKPRKNNFDQSAKLKSSTTNPIQVEKRRSCGADICRKKFSLNTISSESRETAYPDLDILRCHLLNLTQQTITKPWGDPSSNITWVCTCHLYQPLNSVDPPDSTILE